MKELLNLIFKLDFKGLFFTPTENGLIKFFRYAFVGGIAFVVDYLGFALTNMATGSVFDINIRVAVATTVGFILGLIVNFLLSKKFVFTENANVGSKGEFIAYTLIGVVGYFINMALMQVAIKYINEYIAKIIVALIVLVYNYLARKKLLYTENETTNSASM